VDLVRNLYPDTPIVAKVTRCQEYSNLLRDRGSLKEDQLMYFIDVIRTLEDIQKNQYCTTTVAKGRKVG